MSALIIKNKAILIAAITEIASTGKKLDQMIQAAAVSVLYHNDKHSDVTLVNTLVAAMPNGSRVNALRDFLVNFGKVRYSEASKLFEFDKTSKTDLDGAAQIMWTEFAPEKPYVAFDINAMIASVIKKADKTLSDPTHAGEVDLDTLTALRAIQEPEAAAEALATTPETVA